jgi:sugar lactone lactonase YvrE
MGLPDGMTIDEAGNLWVAHWGGSAVRCWCPKTGRCLAQIPLPCTQVTSCAFGGKDLDELLITTAQSGLSEVALAQEPMAGSLFVSRPGVRGLPTKTFAAEKN